MIFNLNVKTFLVSVITGLPIFRFVQINTKGFFIYLFIYAKTLKWSGVYDYRRPILRFVHTKKTQFFIFTLKEENILVSKSAGHPFFFAIHTNKYITLFFTLIHFIFYNYGTHYFEIHTNK